MGAELVGLPRGVRVSQTNDTIEVTAKTGGWRVFALIVAAGFFGTPLAFGVLRGGPTLPIVILTFPTLACLYGAWVTFHDAFTITITPTTIACTQLRSGKKYEAQLARAEVVSFTDKPTLEHVGGRHPHDEKRSALDAKMVAGKPVRLLHLMYRDDIVAWLAVHLRQYVGNGR